MYREVSTMLNAPSYSLTVIVSLILFHHAVSTITSGPLPPSIYDCFEERTKNPVYANEPAERIAETCLFNYGWAITGVRCRNISQETLDVIGRLILPYLKKEDHHIVKRQSQLRVRREYRRLSDAQRNRFHRALQAIKNNGVYDRIAAYHSASIRDSAHGGPAFLPWHRLYIWILENALREQDSSVTLPYWASNLDANMGSSSSASSVIWSAAFAGNGGNRVTSGPFRTWNIRRSVGSEGTLIETSEITDLMRQTSPRQFGNLLENMHNGVHVYVGGFMSTLANAPRDPIFFLHHCYIDYLWWQWQSDNRNNNNVFQYPSTTSRERNQGHGPTSPMLNLNLQGQRLNNVDVYGRDWAFNRFSYEPTPDCGRGTCTGNHLTCPPASQRWEWSWEDFEWRLVSVPSRCTSRRAGSGQPTKRRKRSLQRSRRSDDYHPSLMHALPGPYRYEDMHFPPIEDELPDVDYPKRHPSPDYWTKYNHLHGHAIQNDFRIDCLADYSLWTFLPVKIIRLRPYGMVYDSYAVFDDQVNDHFDIYSELIFKHSSNFTRPENPKYFKTCDPDGAGYTKVTIRSDGINYHGVYRDYVILDDRQPIDGKVGYIAIRRPDHKPTEVLITAHDQCGRICTPRCIVKGSRPPKYVPCSGAITVDDKQPVYYANTYGDAVLKYWKMSGSGCPRSKEGNVYMVFYCDYKNKWFPWPGVKKGKKEYQRN